jgi:cytoskeleton protein RodZ
VFEIGNSLRDARVRQGLEFAELEHSTKIRGKYLRALEDEEFELLPAQTYVKGFLRTYAEYLGLDGQLYVDEYNSRYVAGEDENPLRPRGQPPVHDRRLASRLVLAVVVGIAVVVALVIVAWKFGGSNADQHQATPKKQHAAKHPRKARATSVALDIRATHGYGSYLDVHVGSVAGRQLYRGTLEPGQKQIFRSSKLWARIDAPGNVVVRVNGVRRDLPGGGHPRLVLALPGGRLRLASATG